MRTDDGTVATTDEWDDHWNDYAAAATLNPSVAYRRELIFDVLALGTAPGPVRLLDLGSGTGDLASEAARTRPDAQIVGLDLSARGVEMAGRKVPGARFFQQDFTRPIELGGQYRGWATHAVCSEVLEHLDDPIAMLRNVRALFAPGCRLVVTVPAGPMSAFVKHIGHRRHYTRSLLETTLREAGLKVTELYGAGFPFFNLQVLATVLRGKKLIEDAGGQNGTGVSLAARVGMRVFAKLFKLNMRRSTLGWQLVAVGTEGR